MTTLKGVKQASTAAAMKADRERDKAQAVRDYEEEKRARQANMARLRALRLATERAELKATTTPRSTKKKAAIQTGSEPLVPS
jgi:hypothetical protein